MSYQEQIGNKNNKEFDKIFGTPLVSIIIPTFNRAHVIGETLDSILAQTYPQWECIVVDDGSTDHTDEIMAGYLQKDKRFQYYHRPLDRPKGANACRNYGFEVSKGEYINWFDDDDLMVENRLFLSIRILLRSKPNTFILSKIKFQHKPKFVMGNIPESSENLFFDYITNRIPIALYNPIWPRIIFKNIKLFDENIVQSQDLEFYSRVLKHFQKDLKFMVLQKELIIVRRVDESITSRFSEKKTKEVKSYLEVRKRIMDLDPVNTELRMFIIDSVLSFFKVSLSTRKYLACDLALKFLKNEYCRWDIKSIYSWAKLTFFYKLFRFFGRGETRFKQVFHLSPDFYICKSNNEASNNS